MATKDGITSLGAQDKANLLKKSTKTLPANASDRGFSAEQVIKAMYEPSLMNFEHIKRLIEELKSIFDTYDTSISGKVDVVSGKGLSQNDFSNAYKNLLDNLDTTLTNKLSKTSSIDKVYGTDYEGEQTLYTVDDYPGADGSIVRRSAQTGHIGQIEIPLTPIFNTEAASKKYVDDSKTVIVDALNDTSTAKALSANQGRVLKAAIDAIELLLASNDTDLDTIQEIVTYVKNNKSLIENITTAKVNVADIVDNLTSEISNMPLSAKQGKLLKDLIDALTSSKANASDVYIKSQVDSMVGDVADDIDDIVKGKTAVGKSLTSKQIENVSDESGSYQTKPFIYQATGTDSNTNETSTAPVAKHLELRGQSYVFNQLAKALTQSNYSLGDATATFTDGVATVLPNSQYGCIRTDVKTIAGHKYLFRAKVKKSVATTQIKLGFMDSYVRVIASAEENTDWQYLAGFRTVEVASTYNTIQVSDFGTEDFASFEVKEFECFDLTLMFGAGNEPTSVLEFNRLFPLPYYAYNEGQLVSSQSSKLTTIGYNQFDGELEVGTLSDINGLPAATLQAIRSKNFIKVIAGQSYTYEVANAGSNTCSNFIIYEYDGNQNYITRQIKYYNKMSYELSPNTHYIKFVSYTNGVEASLTNVKVAVYLTWDESRTGYEPYDKHEYALPNVELRSAGSVYDEIKPSGEYIKRVHLIEFTDLTWEYHEASGEQFRNCFCGTLPNNVPTAKPKSGYGERANILCSAYSPSSKQGVEYGTSTDDKVITIRSAGVLMVQDSQYNGDLNAFLQANADTYILYEMETPVLSQVASFSENIIVDDFGTMEFNSTYPQGNEFFYPADYVLLLDDLNKYIDGSIDELAKKSDILGVPNVINASDIVNNTLTQTQMDLITNGKPTLIKGTYLGFKNILITYWNEYSTTWRALAISQGTVFSVMLNTNTKALTEGGTDLGLNKIARLNEKGLPTYPLDTTKQYKFVQKVGGNLDYVEDNDGFNVINASDITPTNLTDDLITILTNGKPTCIVGDCLGYHNPILFPNQNVGGSGNYYGFIIGWSSTSGMYSGNLQAYVILSTTSPKRIQIDTSSRLSTDLLDLNGKRLPAYPSDTGTFVLKCVDGVLTWVAE